VPVPPWLPVLTLGLLLYFLIPYSSCFPSPLLIMSLRVVAPKSGDSGPKRGTNIGSLERRGRHVTRSSCSSLPPSSRFSLRTVQRTSLPLQICPPATPSFQFKFGIFFDDELRGPRATSPLQVGPPVASSPPGTHPSSSIEKRYALPPIRCAAQ
jgi:hypothetical protein